MAKMFTRTITTYRATAAKTVLENGKFVAKVIGSVEYVSASTSKTEARAALKNAGVEVQRGCEVLIEKVAEETFGMPVETFMMYATRIEKGAEVAKD